MLRNPTFAKPCSLHDILQTLNNGKIMADLIQGEVTEVIDGDTFVLNVEQIGTQNKEEYKNSEKIRIANIDAPELKSPFGLSSKISLENKIKGKTVHCTIQTRDSYGRVVATIKIVS